MTVANAKPDQLIRGPLGTATVNAASSAWWDVSTVEAKISEAVAYAVSIGAKYCYIPDCFLPYTASQVTGLAAFHAIGGRLVREGQTNWGWWDVKAYGAAGNDVTDDATAIQAASDGCDVQAGGIVYFPNGTYIVGTGLLIGNRVRWMGTGEGGRDNIIPALNSSAIRAAPTFNGAYLVSNKVQPQEFIWIEKLQIDGNAGNGALCTDCVKLNQVFVNSCFRDVLITNFSGVGLHVTGLTNAVYTGPMLFDNVWVIGTGVQPGSTGHNIVVDSDCWNIWFNNLTSENCASGKSLLRIDGSASSSTSKGHRISNFHGEWNGALVGCIGIELINVTETIVDGATFFVSGTSTGATLVKMTTANRNNSVRALCLQSTIATTLINDVVSGFSTSLSANGGVAHYQQGAIVIHDPNGGLFQLGGAYGGILRLFNSSGRAQLQGSNDALGGITYGSAFDNVLDLGWATTLTAPTLNASNHFKATATSNIAATVPNYTGAPAAGQSQLVTMAFFNNSGGALTTPIAFGTKYKTSAGVSPANGLTVGLTFRYDQARDLLIEIGRGAAV